MPVTRLALAITATLLLGACSCACWTHDGISKVPQDCICKPGFM